MSEVKVVKVKTAPAAPAEPAVVEKAVPAAPAAPAVVEKAVQTIGVSGNALPPQLKVKRLNPNAKLPVYATPGAAAFDLSACLPTADGVGVNATNPRVFDTGLAFEVPPGHMMLVFSRSGQGFKHDIRLSNAVGVVDSDFRGSVKVKLTKDEARSSENYVVYDGDRIAQAVVLPVAQFEFVEVDELSETVRGEGGFGSTDK